MINRHADNPAVQEGILAEIGGMNYTHKWNIVESALLRVSDFAFWGWILSDLVPLWNNKKLPSLSAILGATTILAGMGGYAADAVGRIHDVGKEREKLSHAGKLAVAQAASDGKAEPAR